jgi:anthranilate synthase component I
VYYPSLSEARQLAGEYNLIPVYCEINAGTETPVSIYLKVNRGSNSFLLESAEGGQNTSRYSYIGTEAHQVLTTYGSSETDPLAQIEAKLKKFRVAPITGLPAFCGGAIGYLGYEAVTRFEKLPSPLNDTLGMPESIFTFVDTMLILDRFTSSIKIISCVQTENIEESYSRAVEKINTLVKLLKQSSSVPRLLTPFNAGINAQDTQEPDSNIQQIDFKNKIAQIKDYITSGEAIQVVLSRRMSRPTAAAPFQIYCALRAINPSPYMFYLDFHEFQIIGASPEILVKVENRSVTTRPLAGTRPRGKTPAEDARLEDELKHDEKEKAEHIMLVDLGRNDIGRVSEPGTVKVTDLMDVERYSHVMHLVTNVQGTLKTGLNSFDALRYCFPAGTVSGAPKIRAMEIIAEMEPDKRSVYAGAVGYFSFNGNMDMAIAIRTIVLKQGVAYVQAGCGIVYDSVPENEYEESMNKARALLKAIDFAETGAREEIDASAHRQLR